MYNIIKYMSMHPASNKVRIITTTLFVIAAASFACAEGATSNVKATKSPVASIADDFTSQNPKEMTELQMTARQYRAQGLALQNAGDLDSAMNLYQKAIQYDPFYAVVYNDLGVVYEAKGFNDRAKECYLRSIQIDPNYLSAYSNLAIFYEGQRDLQSAANYWERRAKLGNPEDPWTKKAALRLNDIRLVMSDKPFEEAKEQEVIGLMSSVSKDKTVNRRDNKALANTYYKKAKLYYKKGDEETALKLAIDASQLDPANREIEAFVTKLQRRVLSK